MRNYHWIKKLGFLLFVVSLAAILQEISWSPVPVLLGKAIAQTSSAPTPSRSLPKSPQIRPAKSTWEVILALLKGRKESSLGSRGSICAMSPGLLGEKNIIWSDRPLFLWQGAAPQFEIRLYSPFSTHSEQELLWSQAVTLADPSEKWHSMSYTGQALQPGQSYDWELSFRGSHAFRYTFLVMVSPERDRIAVDLKLLETSLKAAGVTAEEIALERANYFAQRDLWSDVLQEIYAVKNPSPEMVSNAQEMVSYLCQSSHAENP